MRKVANEPVKAGNGRSSRRTGVRAPEGNTSSTFHAILQLFKRKSTTGVVLNTSFNLHEEPIVCTPEEAVAAFQRAGLDDLVIGGFIVSQKQRL